MRILQVTALLVFMAPFVCTGQTEDADTTTKTATPDQSQEDIRTIHIYGINQMKYVVKTSPEAGKTGDEVKASDGNKYLLLENIEVSAGQKIRIRLTTVGELPASSMSHNWILLKSGVKPSDFASSAIQAKDRDYIPEGQEEAILAHTGLAGGGETVEVTFTAPEKKGSYDYLCTFPGHFQGGMKGKLIVN